MRLVDEIEEAVDRAHWQALLSLMPRIRAALLAGEEMAEHLGERFDCLEAVDRFRAATEGTK